MIRSILYHLIHSLLKWFLLSIFLPLFIFVLQQDFTNYSNWEKERLSYSQKIIDLTERRAYLAENFYRNSKSEPDFDIRKDKLWEAYAEATSELNYNLVPSLIIVEKNFGPDVQSFYHNEVFMRLRTIHIEIAKIRTGDPYNEKLLSDNIEELRNRKYRFAETLLKCEPQNMTQSLNSFINRQKNIYNCKVY